MHCAAQGVGEDRHPREPNLQVCYPEENREEGKKGKKGRWMLTSLLILSASSSARIRPALPVVASIAKTLFFRELSPTELTLLEVGEVGIFLAEAGLGNSSKPLSCVTLESCVSVWWWA